MALMNLWLATLMQTTDSGFPSGAYAHSMGLEGLVELGVVRDTDTLRLFLFEHLLPALEYVELPYLRFAYAAAANREFEVLEGLGIEYGASRLMRESAQASLSLGRQRLEMLRQISGKVPLLEAFSEHCAKKELAHLVIVAGVQAAAREIPLDAAMTAFAYSAAVSTLAASLKLIRIGQVASQRLLAEVIAVLPPVVERSRSVERDDAGWFNPLMDIAAARHETAYTRLFIS